MTGPKTNEREGTRASLQDAQMSAYKVRVVLDLIRGHEVGRAADILRFCERGPAEVVGKVLASAVANAAHNDELDPEELFVSACYADEGKTARRMRPRARGRAARIRKRSSHITVIVSRLPEDRLGRLRAKRAAEQANRRARRGGAAQTGAAARSRRTGKAAPEAETTTAAPVHEPVTDGMAESAIEAGIVDTDVAAVEHNEFGTDAAGAGREAAESSSEATAEAAGIVDEDAAGVEVAEAQAPAQEHPADEAEGSEK
jgi:large subunit ribosomal protein L22